MAIPPPILQAASSGPSGRMVLVLGAGCSVEPPTRVPLAREVSLEAHRLLLSDGVLNSGDCTSPSDLSQLADAVYVATGSVTALVERMPVQRFKTARPNDGYLIAAALLREHRLRSVLTLNFDLAMSAALVELEADDVTQVHSPGDTHGLADPSVIYLHRSAYVSSNEWVLRTDQMIDGWGDWEEAIAGRVLATPLVVFAGLGSPAALLTETVSRIRGALATGVAVYQADVSAHADSSFAAALGVSEEHFIQLGWCDLMREIADRVLSEQLQTIESEAATLVAEDGVAAVEVGVVLASLAALGLVGLGRLRASWTTEPSGYRPAISSDEAHIADIVLGVALIAIVLESAVEVAGNGIVSFRSSKGTIRVGFVSGEGRRSRVGLSQQIRRLNEGTSSSTNLVVLSALRDGAAKGADLSAPENLIGTIVEGSLIAGPDNSTVVSLDEIRLMPDVVKSLQTREVG